MEWRCEWCGKPHEENDPPCDNCGHGTFERAVAPVAPEGEGGPTVWICTECGKDHPRNNPPCSRCGAMTLEQREQTYEEGDPIGPGVAADAAGKPDEEPAVGSDVMTVWACTECGKGHTRNNPPCSRCGNMTFERRERRYDDAELASGGWLDAIDLKVALGFLGAFALLALLVATSLGIVTLPGQSTGTVPLDQVPGEGETAAGLDLATVEEEYVAELDERRAAAGRMELTRSAALDRRATWYNRRVVQAEYTDAPAPSRAEFQDTFDAAPECSGQLTSSTFSLALGSTQDASLSDFDAEGDLAVALVDRYVGETGGDFLGVSDGFVGVDVHVGPDGDVFVTQFVC